MNANTHLEVAYCTNVHAGTDLPTLRENLARYAGGVARRLDTHRLPVGLWIPASAAQAILPDTKGFADFLEDNGLDPLTINGFPYDNFHSGVVKHDVYRPTWADGSRFDYTMQLAEILAAILPVGRMKASISTLPIGWPVAADPTDVSMRSSGELKGLAGANLRNLANRLARLRDKTGRTIIVAIEPEPGCILDIAEDIVDFFASELPESLHREFIQVCHDVCHSSVMGESQAETLRKYARANIGLAKIQVSSGIVANWQAMAIPRRAEALEQLSQFAEDRYLHQTGQVFSGGGFRLAEDLPQAIAAARQSESKVPEDDRWVVHFHVPIFLDRFGHLTTTQDDIGRAIAAAIDPVIGIDFTGHLEIETYAWTVLPESMRRRELEDEIADEFRWLKRKLFEIQAATQPPR
ncbi:MAG: metabolite traffic protein EboE [Planctomycetota bacterium]